MKRFARRLRFNEAGVVHAGEAGHVRSSRVPGVALQRGRRCSRRRGLCRVRRGGSVRELQRGRRCSRRRGASCCRRAAPTCGFNEAGVVHAGEALWPMPRRRCSRWLQRGRRCSRRRGESDALSAKIVEKLQRGRRCSRRRGHLRRVGMVRGLRLQRGRRCSRRRGPNGSQRDRKRGCCFNEAGVVHAGEDTHGMHRSTNFQASTRPALFTPERTLGTHPSISTDAASTRPALFTPERQPRVLDPGPHIPASTRPALFTPERSRLPVSRPS